MAAVDVNLYPLVSISPIREVVEARHFTRSGHQSEAGTVFAEMGKPPGKKARPAAIGERPEDHIGAGATKIDKRNAPGAVAESMPSRAKRPPGAKLLPLVQGLREEVKRLAKRGGPVLVGPFTGEVGFELLYWIPLVRWAVREFPSLQGRLVVVSRGGVAHWWQSFLDADYIDIFSVCEPEEYLVGKGPDKQRSRREFDNEILDRVRARLRIDRAEVFHPSLLFDFYYQARRAASDVFVKRLSGRPDGADGLAAVYEPIPKPELPAELDELLPDEFVATRFYFRDSFPDSPDNRRFAVETVTALCRSHHVVVLNNGMQLDDHSDVDHLPDAVIRLDHLMTPSNNLAIQTAALSRARALVGTYGGLAYLAPLLQVPAIGFSSAAEEAAPWHLALARAIFGGPAFAPLVTLTPGELAVLGVLTPDGVLLAS
jgi:hypothetical protein